MAKRKEEQPEVFYVGISEPKEMRRNLLESLKGTILILQTYERISKKRREKVEKILLLKNVLSDIDSLLNAVKRRLPKTRVRTTTAESDASPSSTRSRRVYPKVGEIERLEQELTTIEDKLGKL